MNPFEFVFARTFAHVAAVVSDSNLTIVGDGTERAELERLAEVRGVGSRDYFTGAHHGDDLPREVVRHMCLKVPSTVEESIGIVALEGLARCERVLVTCRGGLPEAVGKYGIVVEVEMLRSALARSDGLRQPSTHDNATPADHLERHTMQYISARYLEVIMAATRSAKPNADGDR